MEKYFKIFLGRELSSILGKGWVNLWILFIVFVVTIGSLSVSRAGLHFLRQKMEDPFIHWVEVKEQGRQFEDFYEYTKDCSTEYGISAVETNNYVLEYVFDKDNKNIRVEGRTISTDSKLLDRILDQTNATQCLRSEQIKPDDYGWIVTKGLMERLGYNDENSYPHFIDLAYPSVKENVVMYGIHAYGINSKYVSVPIPIIAVVDRLPNLLDFMTTNYFYEQMECSSNPFNISNHEMYYYDLNIATVSDDNSFKKYLHDCLDASGLQYDEDINVEDYPVSFEPLKKYRIILRMDTSSVDTSFFYKQLNELADNICKGSECKCYRIYDYDFEYAIGNSSPDYLSFMFEDLSRVNAFADTAFQKYDIKVEMSQVEAKGNFDSFNNMANVLCYAIMFISIVFLVLFLLFLIDNHFQKISSNLGTIMAFGLDNVHIMKIYGMVFMLLIFIGLAMSIVTLYIVQYLLCVLGVVHDFYSLPYLNMNDLWVCLFILGILVVSSIVIILTLHQKLKATPGDLIRNKNK